jgi:rRNA maturation endonuclease Nob1
MHCEHVYKEMDTDVCPLCGMPTHRVDWKKAAELHKEWIDSGKAVTQGWSSI